MCRLFQIKSWTAGKLRGMIGNNKEFLRRMIDHDFRKDETAGTE